MKFGLDQKFEFKKSFELYCQTSMSFVTLIFVQSKRFGYWTRQNEMKFGLEQKFEFEKSFELYCQTLARFVTLSV